MKIDKRGLLGLGAFGAAGLLGTGAAQAAPSRRGRRSFDPFNADHNLDAYVRLRGDLAGKPSVGWFDGHVFGVVGRERLLPLFGFEGFGVGRYEAMPDGTVRQYWREIAMFKDMGTGEFLTTWKNPYSGETVDVLDVQNDPINIVLSNRTPQIPPAPGRDLLFGNYNQGDRLIMPWTIDRANDYACMFYDGHGVRTNPLDPTEWPRESSGKSLRVSEFIQFWCRLSDLENTRLTGIDYVGSWQRIADWLPWMLMDGREGHLFYRTALRKFSSVNQLPPKLLAHAKATYPQFLTPPETWTVQNVSSFDVFKRLRKPAPAKR
jgi:Protein of unknown function (DUF1838)